MPIQGIASVKKPKENVYKKTATIARDRRTGMGGKERGYLSHIPSNLQFSSEIAKCLNSGKRLSIDNTANNQFLISYITNESTVSSFSKIYMKGRDRTEKVQLGMMIVL